MSRAAFNRMLLLVHGQGDELDNPLPGFWGRSGGARIDTQLHEMDSDVAPDADRVIQPPEPLSDDMRSRMNRNAAVIGVALFALLAALVGISDPRFTP